MTDGDATPSKRHIRYDPIVVTPSLSVAATGFPMEFRHAAAAFGFGMHCRVGWRTIFEYVATPPPSACPGDGEARGHPLPPTGNAYRAARFAWSLALKGSCDSAMSGPGGIVPVVPRSRGARCVHAWMESRA